MEIIASFVDVPFDEMDTAMWEDTEIWPNDVQVFRPFESISVQVINSILGNGMNEERFNTFTTERSFLKRFSKIQIPVLRSLTGDETAIRQYLARFDFVNSIPYSEWKKEFAPSRCWSRLDKRGCTQRAYLSFLTMLEEDYDYEISFLKLSIPELAQKVNSEADVTFSYLAAVCKVVQDKLLSNGGKSMMEWARTELRFALEMQVNNVFELCEGANISLPEAKWVVSRVMATGIRNDASIRKLIIDSIQEDHDKSLQESRKSNYEIEIKCDADGNVQLCKFCGCTFLVGEKLDGSWCCNGGILNKYRLKPVPEIVLRRIEMESANGSNCLAMNSRKLNNFFCFAKLNTSVYNPQTGVDLNANAANHAFKICGRTYCYIPRNVGKTFLAFVRDGTELPMQMDQTCLDMVEPLREVVATSHPLGRAFRFWGSPNWSNHFIVISGKNAIPEQVEDPQEMSVLMIPPDAATRQPRGFEIMIDPARRLPNDNRPEKQYLQSTDARWDTCHYPLLHFEGELGWGLDNNWVLEGDRVKKISLEQYLRFRMLSADHVTVFNGENEVNLVPYMRVSADGENYISSNRFNFLSKVGQEYMVDNYSRIQDHRLHFEMNKPVNAGADHKYLTSNFFGSKRFMADQAANALQLVKRVGMPLFFITVTCNSNWDDFKKVMTKGQTPLDSPVWVARIFKNKIGRFMSKLKTGAAFPNCKHLNKLAFSLRGGLGKFGFSIKVIEFQKRGMPHAHILFRPWNAKVWEDAMRNEEFDWVDGVVTAEIPEEEDWEFLSRFGMLDEDGEVVSDVINLPNGHRYAASDGAYRLLEDIREKAKMHMTHKCSAAYCLADGPCRFWFPFVPRTRTGLSECKQFLLYKRKENDCWVVPYNPWILLSLDCHCNVVICHNEGCIGYLYKYCFKGVDKAKFGFAKVDEFGNLVEIDEFEEYISARYLSASEACWRTLGYHIHSQTPSVDSLIIHETGKSQKCRGNSELEKYLARPMQTQEQRLVFENLTLIQFHENFICRTERYKKEREDWYVEDLKLTISRRRCNQPKFYRVKEVPFNETEQWALRLLLLSLPHPRVEDANGVVSRCTTAYCLRNETYLKTCIRLNLFREGREASIVFEHARDVRTPAQLRWLLGVLMNGGHYILDVLHDETDPSEIVLHSQNLFSLTCDQSEIEMVTTGDRYQFVLRNLWNQAKSAGFQAGQTFGIPVPQNWNLDEDEEEVVRKERGRWSLQNILQIVPDIRNREMQVNSDATQREAYETIVDHVMSKSGIRMFFLDGPAGTGKSTVIDTIVWHARLNQKIVRVSALTWLAASNFHEGVSLHNLFKIIPPDVGDLHTIDVSGASQALLDAASVIVIDEVPFASFDLFEAVVNYLHSRFEELNLNHGLAIVCAGDFRQLAPVSKNCISEAAVAAQSIITSPFWDQFHIFQFTKQHRIQDEKWSKLVESIGDGTSCFSNPGDEEHQNTLKSMFDTEKMTSIHLNTLNASVVVDISDLGDESENAKITTDVDKVIDFVQENGVVLTTTNDRRIFWNNEIQSRRPGELCQLPAVHELAAGGADIAEDEELDEITMEAVPSAKLALKKGDICIMVSAVAGFTELVNNSRVKIISIHPSKKFITVEKVGDRTHQRFDIPRRWYRNCYWKGLSFARLQFPLELAFAITVHKSQGQTLSRVVLDLTKPIFAHGQLYVALSRVRRREDIIFFSAIQSREDQPILANNIVFKSFLLAERVNIGRKRRALGPAGPRTRTRQTRWVRN